MPKYKVRLEAQDDSGHFRVNTFHADDEDAARARCLRLEDKIVAFTLPDEQLDLPDGHPDAPRRGERTTHAQTEPYEIVSVTEYRSTARKVEA